MICCSPPPTVWDMPKVRIILSAPVESRESTVVQGGRIIGANTELDNRLPRRKKKVNKR